MNTPTRIYKIKPKTGAATPRLVRAAHPAHALRHVATDVFDVTVATHDDLEDLLGDGVKVERITAEQHELPVEAVAST